MNNNKKIWITWERHRRTLELSSVFEDIQLFELESSAPRLIRYISLLTRTILILIKEKPKLVITQSPSNVLALFMVTMGRFFTDKIVIDAHNGGVRPFHAKFHFILPIFAFIHKKADLVIVTNKALAEVIADNKGKSFILEDKLPQFQSIKRKQLSGGFNLVSICTFEADEPFQEIIQAASLIDQNIKIYITGNYSKIGSDSIDSASSNVIFTGYLPEAEYISLLSSCDAIIDLTNEPDCLVCGAYEAVSLEKPLLLTKTTALKNYFYTGVVFTENTSDKIADAISTVILKKDALNKQIYALKHEITADFDEKVTAFNYLLGDMAAS